MSIKVVGIDLTKNSFQVCVLSISGSMLSNRKVKLDTIRQLPENTTIAMESVQHRITGEESSKNWG